MLGRTIFVILFFWAALTVITPILIRLSASANLMDINGDTNIGDIQNIQGVGLLSRRALGSIGHPKKERSTSSSTSPSPSVSLELHRQVSLELHRQPLSEWKEWLGNWDISPSDGILKAFLQNELIIIE